MPDATVIILPGGYRFVWPAENIKASLTRFADDRRSQSSSCEVTIESTGNPVGHLHTTRLNLTSTTQKRDLIRTMMGCDENLPWRDMIEYMSIHALAMHRKGEPVISIGSNPLSDAAKYRVWPVCPEGVATVIFGEGGTGKSFFATFVSVLVQTGRASIGLRPTQGNVLYLDYETSGETLNERVKAICEGLSIPPVKLLYRYCYHPIAEDIDSLYDIFADQSIAFVVVDSLGPACGGDPNDAELAIRMFNALRQLRTTSLLLDHIAKNQVEGTKPTPYGSVYKVNLARSVWQLKAGDRSEAQSITDGLYHRKTNYGPQRKAIGFKMTFQSDPYERLLCMKFASVSVGDDTYLGKELPLKDRIKAELRHGSMTVSELAEQLSEKEPNVRTTLNRNRGFDFVNVGDGKWGLIAVESTPSV